MATKRWLGEIVFDHRRRRTIEQNRFTLAGRPEIEKNKKIKEKDRVPAGTVQRRFGNRLPIGVADNFKAAATLSSR